MFEKGKGKIGKLEHDIDSHLLEFDLGPYIEETGLNLTEVSPGRSEPL